MLKNNIQKNYLGQQAGFTLIELLIIVFIISLLSSIILANYRGGQKTYALSQTTQKLVSDLRRAQNMAMSGVDIGEIEGEPGKYYCGYGIETNYNARPTSYRFFLDKSPNCQNSNNIYDSSDVIVETVNLPNKIRIKLTTPSPPLDRFFKPPDPTTYIKNNSGVGILGIITLEIEDTSLTKIITVTTAGLIYSN